MLEIYPHLPSPFPFFSFFFLFLPLSSSFFLFLPQKNGGKFEKDSYLFQISHHVFFNLNRSYTPSTILASIFSFLLISRATFNVGSHFPEM